MIVKPRDKGISAQRVFIAPNMVDENLFSSSHLTHS